ISFAVPVLAVGLCALPAGTAGERSSPNPRLRDTRSAYSERASRQPAEWWFWGAEAWRRARETDLPVLLDLGTMWCSFCEQMDRDSSSQPGGGGSSTRHFVAVRVEYDAQPELAATIEPAQPVLNLRAGLPVTACLV